MSGSILFILNQQEKIVGMLKNGGSDNSLPFFDDLLVEDLTTGAETFRFSTILNDNVSSNLIVGNYIAFMKGESYKLFQIVQTEETHDETLNIEVYCESAGLGLLNNAFRGRDIPSADLREFLSTILEDTSWNVGAVDYGINEVYDLNLETGSVYSILQNNIGKYGAELAFRVEINKGRISNKFVDAFKFRGRVTNQRFVFGRNIQGLKRTVDSTELFTALIGQGNNGISFKDVTVPEINKPLGQDFVSDDEAFNNYNNNGNHLIGVYQYDTDSPEELLRATYKRLQEVKTPKITYDVDVELLNTTVNIGDTVNVVDMFFPEPILLNARVSKLETSITNPEANKCTLANFIEAHSNISKDLLSQLEGFITGTIGDKFPIKNEDISNGAVTGDKIYQNSISTDHLMADSIDANKIQANSIKSKHIEAGTITADKIDVDLINAIEGKFESVEADIIVVGDMVAGKADIGTVTAVDGKIDNLAANVATIKDLEATNAKIENLESENAKINNLLAGNITADNIAAGSITADSGIIKDLTADVIKTGTLDANLVNVTNLNAESIKTGTIDASKINVINLDASQITSGKINASIIEGLEITANDIKTGTLDASLVNVIKLNASNITTGTLDASKINVIKLNANSITSGTLDASIVNVTNLNGSNITAGTIDASKVKITNLNAGAITSGELDASKINVIKISASNITSGTINGKLINVTNLNASNINTGTFDASKVNVTNLTADSITAGSITILGENLIHQSDFNATDKWIISDSNYWSIDIVEKFENVNSMKYIVPGTGGTATHYIKSEEVACAGGENFVVSAYFMRKSNASMAKIEVEYLNNSGEVINVDSFNVVFGNNGSWNRSVFQTRAINNSSNLRIKITASGPGVFWVAKPMVSKGSIASVWKKHNDELISNGAIGNDQLGDAAITTNKLNLEELFVSDSAFIANLSAVNLRAEQITTGKIDSERLDITGIVSFDALSGDLKDKFIFDTTQNKTFINGGQIYTNSVTAEKINAKGLTVLDDSNNITFNIDNKGEVFVTGTIQSSNFDEASQQGYKITKDGNVIMNNAIVRGDVLLPDAGITNFGSTKGNENILSKNDILVSGATLDKDQYLTHDGRIIYDKGSITYSGIYIEDTIFPKRETQYTISFSIKKLSGALEILGGHSDTCFKSPQVWVDGIRYNNAWSAAQAYPNIDDGGYHKIKIVTSLSESGNGKFYIQPNRSTATSVKVEIMGLKIEEGTEATLWCPAKVDQINNVRFWAGTDFEKREGAPFRVYEDGSFVASKGNIGGTFTGELHIGNIHIADTNTTEASFEIKTNNNVETIVKLTDSESFIDSPFVFGNKNNKIIYFDKASKSLKFNESTIELSNKNNYFTNINSNNSILEIGKIDGDINYKHSLKYNTGSMQFINEGAANSSLSDFIFKRSSGQNVKVDVEGEMNITDIIRLGSMKIARRNQAGNEGVDFIL